MWLITVRSKSGIIMFEFDAEKEAVSFLVIVKKLWKI